MTAAVLTVGDVGKAFRTYGSEWWRVLSWLGVPVATLKAFKDGAITDQQFDDALAPHLDAAQYGDDIKAWVKNQANYDKIMGLLVLADPSGGTVPGRAPCLNWLRAPCAQPRGGSMCGVGSRPSSSSASASIPSSPGAKTPRTHAA